MPEVISALGAVAGGVSSAAAAFALVRRPQGLDAASWLAHRNAQQDSPAESTRPWLKTRSLADARGRLAYLLERAGWKESPKRMVIHTAALAGSMGVAGVAAALMTHASNGVALGVFGFTVGVGSAVAALRSAITARRRRLAAELVPLLELFTLELSGGGNAVSALGIVTSKVQGELAADIRRLMIAGQVTGSAPFEARLSQYAERLDIAALAGLATILGSSREYGTGVVHGVRALARDLRHAQRRELIVHSRKALNHVLIPAGVGVLLPFLAVVMFPAVTALQGSLR